jgi:hypothetical protein
MALWSLSEARQKGVKFSKEKSFLLLRRHSVWPGFLARQTGNINFNEAGFAADTFAWPGRLSLNEPLSTRGVYVNIFTFLPWKLPSIMCQTSSEIVSFSSLMKLTQFFASAHHLTPATHSMTEKLICFGSNDFTTQLEFCEFINSSFCLLTSRFMVLQARWLPMLWPRFARPSHTLQVYGTLAVLSFRSNLILWLIFRVPRRTRFPLRSVTYRMWR